MEKYILTLEQDDSVDKDFLGTALQSVLPLLFSKGCIGMASYSIYVYIIDCIVFLGQEDQEKQSGADH